MSDPTAELAFSVIVVSYGTRQLTLDCLRSLYMETSAPAFEVFVVDNASGDGSAEAIAEAFPQAQLLVLDENLGFGAANNLAAERAKGRRLLLLNSDTVVRERALEALWQDSEAHPAAGIWGGRTLFADGTLNRSSCWGAPTPWSALCLALGLASAFPRSAYFNPEGLGAWERESAREVPIVSGCLMLVDAQLWRRLGGFHEDFFMYGEDADLCLRARAEGAAPRITPTATIVHLGGASERARAGKMVRLFTAKAQLYAKFWGPVSGRFGLLTLDIWALHRMLAFSLAGLMRPAQCTARDTWREVWHSRGTWHAAFDRTDSYRGRAHG